MVGAPSLTIGGARREERIHGAPDLVIGIERLAGGGHVPPNRLRIGLAVVDLRLGGRHDGRCRRNGRRGLGHHLLDGGAPVSRALEDRQRHPGASPCETSIGGSVAGAVVASTAPAGVGAGPTGIAVDDGSTGSMERRASSGGLGRGFPLIWFLPSFLASYIARSAAAMSCSADVPVLRM